MRVSDEKKTKPTVVFPPSPEEDVLEHAFVAPTALPVKNRLLTFDAKLTSRGLLAVTVSGRDRTGVLQALVRQVREYDASIALDAGFAKTVEDHFVIFLLLRHLDDPRRLVGFVDHLAAWGNGSIEGLQIPVAAKVKLVVRTADRPDVLPTITAVLSEEPFRVNISQFSFEAYSRFDSDDLAQHPPQSLCVLRFDLDLSEATFKRTEDLRQRVFAEVGLDSEVLLIK